jgi:molecular chaperone DnaK
MGNVIGIDLGTTNSCVSVVENGKAVIIPSDTGSRTTPSVVAFSKDGERYVGDTARRQLVVNPDRTISSIKRQMGTNWSMKIDGSLYKPQTISAYILMKLKQDAEKYLGQTVNDAVITVPAYFNDTQRQATKDAGAIAGLNVLRIINEPTSAAMSYGLDHGDSKKVMVFDLGGGTFDVSIIDIADGIIEVMATSGDNHLGGDDFDERIADWIAEQFKQEHRIDLRKDFAARQRIREAAEQAKKELSSATTAQINLPYIAKDRSGPLHLDLTFTRDKLNELIGDLIGRTEAPVVNALADAGISASKLDMVLLVGGSTRVPAVKDKVKKLTGKEPSQNINPDECVAMGAAILGSTLTGNALISRGTGQSLMLFDVTPLSLSIETMGGVATRLIERNTTIPFKYTKEFTTASPMQTTIEVNVLQGERPMAHDNKTIGKFMMHGIRRSNSGMPRINVTFDIDANGILKVSAQDLTTGKMQSVTITASDRMSDTEIEQARRDAEMYSATDGIRKDGLALTDECRRLILDTDNRLKEQKKQMYKAKYREIKKDVSELERLTSKFRADKVTAQDVDAMRQAKERLEASAGSIGA